MTVTLTDKQVLNIRRCAAALYNTGCKAVKSSIEGMCHDAKLIKLLGNLEGHDMDGIGIDPYGNETKGTLEKFDKQVAESDRCKGSEGIQIEDCGSMEEYEVKSRTDENLHRYREVFDALDD